VSHPRDERVVLDEAVAHSNGHKQTHLICE